MKLFKTLIAGLLLTVSATAMAQATYTDAQNNKYEFQKHWFLNLQGGAQYTAGSRLSVLSRIRHAFAG